MNVRLILLPCIFSLTYLHLTVGFIVDTINGNDNNSGETINDPFKTIARCVAALSDPGDECLIRAGYYHEFVNITGLQGTPENPIRIAGFEDEQPVWDGTVSIQPDTWEFDPNTGICSAVIGTDITALFYKNDLLTPARWPNSKWSDKSFFDHHYWRPCPNSKRGTIVDDELAQANLDFTNAMAILNIGSWETYVAQVLSYEMGSNNFTYNDTFGDIKFKHQQYYLEASFELLDAPEEWFYDMSSGILSLIMPDFEVGMCPDSNASPDILRGRTYDNVIEFTDCSNVIMKDITFRASNFIANDGNSDLTFDSLIFDFPSSSHRMLKDATKPLHTKMYGDNNAVINCSFYGSEGPALQYNGNNMIVHNSEFVYNDWVGQGNLGTVMDKGSGESVFSQNTLYYNGVAHGLRYTGRGSDFTLNHIEGQCWGKIQQDGASIQVSTGAQNGINISYNWIHDSPKKGIRFDGNGDPLGVHGYAGFNVVWNHADNREIDAKGDNHTVVNNVGWDDDESDCTVCVPNSHSGNPMNRNSIVLNNAARKMTGGGGIIENNYNSTDVKEQMMDTDNYDFRPLPGGNFITPDGGEIIGAYTWGPSSLTYWMPGRKLYKSSFPIPRNGAAVSTERADVICQTGYLAEEHDFYFGETFEEVDLAVIGDGAYQMTLFGEENIFAIPSLLADKEYFWRVDARKGENTYKGDVWSFSSV